MAIERFTASLAHELAALNVRAKLVEPGCSPTTRFTTNGVSRMKGLFPEACAAFADPVLEAFADVTTITKEAGRRGRVPGSGRSVGSTPLSRGCGRGGTHQVHKRR
jgi:hypothetical protein